MTTRFEKWQGLGNDFVVIDGSELRPDEETIRRLCDRRRGIGADGVLIVERNPARMIVFNADGGRPEMCGNGLRCVTGFLGAEAGSSVAVQTDAGLKQCRVLRTDGGTFDVSIAMGFAEMHSDLVVQHAGKNHAFSRVDLGNPHAITFEPADSRTIDELGPIVATAPPGGTNVEFCTLVPGDGRSGADGEPRVEVIVWERGVGRTLACGTGACAVAALACHNQKASFDVPLRVRLPGGDLVIQVTRDTYAIEMRGPAVRVFSGTL